MMESPKAPQGSPEAEKISAAALSYQGRIFTGPTHAHAIKILEREFPEWQFGGLEDGFLTTKGRFVSRIEASEIAQREGQVEENDLDTVQKELDSHNVKGMRRIDWEGE